MEFPLSLPAARVAGLNLARKPILSEPQCKTLLSNCTFDRGRLTPAYVKPFDLFVAGAKMGIGSPRWTIFTTGSSVPRDLMHLVTVRRGYANSLNGLKTWARLQDGQPTLPTREATEDDGVLFGIEVCIEVVAGPGWRERSRHRQAPLGIKGHDLGGIIPPRPPRPSIIGKVPAF
jgi:hypothetical protein